MTDDKKAEPLTDRETVTRIFTRYHGRWDTLELTPEVRTQLAYHLGFLAGLCHRLLERDRG